MNGSIQAVELRRRSSRDFEVLLDGSTVEVRVRDRDDSHGRFEIDGIIESLDFHLAASLLNLQFRGGNYQFADRSRSPVSTGPARGDGRIRASMNGRVVAVHVNVGDVLAVGQPVFTLEAMKMEHTHTAPVAGVLMQLNVALGDQVGSARVVAEIQKESS